MGPPPAPRGVGVGGAGTVRANWDSRPAIAIRTGNVFGLGLRRLVGWVTGRTPVSVQTYCAQ